MTKKDAFVHMIKEHEGIIYKVATIYASNREDQEDLYQDIVFQLWNSFGSFRKESKRSTWMYRVALNTAITHFKKQKRRGQSVSLAVVFENRIDYTDTVTEHRLQLLYNHIQKLNNLEKGIILLYLEGRSYEEIGGIIGFTSTNVGTRIGRIKEKLKENIKK